MAERSLDELSEELKPLRVNTVPLTETKVDNIICCICQEVCVNPVQLPCSHIFCFLCIKGVAARSNHCALCRHKINPDVLDHPDVVNRGEIQTSIKESGESHKWYYEAKNGGWWLYEQRTSTEIEKAFNDKKASVRLQISGFYYTIDFESMVQYREEFPTRRRRIKRDRVKVEAVKGVAGITVENKEHQEQGRNQVRREMNRKGLGRSEVDNRWPSRNEIASGEQDQRGAQTGLRRNETGSSEQDQKGMESIETGARRVARSRSQERSAHDLGTRDESGHIQSGVDSDAPTVGDVHSDAVHDSEDHQTRLVTGHD